MYILAVSKSNKLLKSKQQHTYKIGNGRGDKNHAEIPYFHYGPQVREENQIIDKEVRNCNNNK